MLGMYMNGAMLSSEQTKKKIGGGLTEGMPMPYGTVVHRAGLSG